MAVLNTFASHFENAATVLNSLQNVAARGWNFSKPAVQSLTRLFAAVAIHNPRMTEDAYADLLSDADECGAELPALPDLERGLQPFAEQLAHAAPLDVRFDHLQAA